jgi:hypothetical protein
MVQIIKTGSKMEKAGNMLCTAMEKNTAFRYRGKWYKINKKPFEPERQTYEVAWIIIKENLSSQDAYRKWYSNERDDSKLLYPSFKE